jgi:hypothetical protein
VNFEQMFLNTVEGLEAGGAKLQHVQFVSGEACNMRDVLRVACTSMKALISASQFVKPSLLCNVCRYQMVRCMTCDHHCAPLLDARGFGQVSYG